MHGVARDLGPKLLRDARNSRERLVSLEDHHCSQGDFVECGACVEYRKAHSAFRVACLTYAEYALALPDYAAKRLVLRCRACKGTMIYKHLPDGEIEVYHGCEFPKESSPSGVSPGVGTVRDNDQSLVKGGGSHGE